MAVREKKVELFELFYDLVFVYAISRVTLILEETVDGAFTFSQMLIYLISTLTVFQAWVFMTNYINRYCKWRWHDYLLLSINMFAAIYLSQAISTDWGVDNARVFTLSMMILVVTVLILYVMEMILERDNVGAKHGALSMGLILVLFGASLAASYTHLDYEAFYLLIGAIVLGAILPLVTPKFYDSGIVCFPHLVERFELLTIVTFGEGIVGMTRFFNIHHITQVSWSVFITVFLMFGCYVIQVHRLCNHHRDDTGKRLMFSHYFIILAVNLVTVAYLLFSDPESDRLFTASLMTVSLLLFFVGIMSNSPYYDERYPHSFKDYLVVLAFIALGAFVMFTFMDTERGISAGAFIAVVGNLMVLSYRYIKYRPKKEQEALHEG